MQSFFFFWGVCDVIESFFLKISFPICFRFLLLYYHMKKLLNCVVVAFLITFPRSQIDIAKNYLQIFSLSVVPLYVKEVLAYFSLGIKYGFIEFSFGD